MKQSKSACIDREVGEHLVILPSGSNIRHAGFILNLNRTETESNFYDIYLYLNLMYVYDPMSSEKRLRQRYELRYSNVKACQDT